jgi:hypothetical protein
VSNEQAKAGYEARLKIKAKVSFSDFMGYFFYDYNA